jgi:copper resistance protein B
VQERAFGKTSDFRREEGIATKDTRFVAGIRIWF